MDSKFMSGFFRELGCQFWPRNSLRITADNLVTLNLMLMHLEIAALGFIPKHLYKKFRRPNACKLFRVGALILIY